VVVATILCSTGTAWAAPAEAGADHGPSSSSFPSHHFQLEGRSAQRPQVGVNFGLLQLAMHGFNVAAEFRYKRLWAEYSHGQALTLNAMPISLTAAERDQGLHLYVPYTTGFGLGATIIDELWAGVEFKTHRYEVAAPSGAEVHYQTYSIGPVVGFKFFIWRGLHVNVYARYWPNVASTLPGGHATLANGTGAPSIHEAHSFDFFANAAIGWATDI
jgi:hypothetical protein